MSPSDSGCSAQKDATRRRRDHGLDVLLEEILYSSKRVSWIGRLMKIVRIWQRWMNARREWTFHRFPTNQWRGCDPRALSWSGWWWHCWHLKFSKILVSVTRTRGSRFLYIYKYHTGRRESLLRRVEYDMVFIVSTISYLLLLTVRLTRIYHRVPENKDFRFLPAETIIGQVK